LQGIYTAFKALFSRSQPVDLRLDLFSSSGTDHIVTSRSCISQFLGDAQTFTPAHEDFVLHESFKLTDCLLKVPLFTLLYITLINEYGLVDRIIKRLCIKCHIGWRAVVRLQPYNAGSE